MRPARPILSALGLLAMLAATSSCGSKDKTANYANSYEGRMPPALLLDGTTWLNVEGTPSLDRFRGKVVFLEFGFLR